MLDRFKDAQWYIGGGDELNTIIYDASFLEGDGPDGHGMVCRDDTEPRCDVCNQLINTQGQCEDDPSHYQRVRE